MNAAQIRSAAGSVPIRGDKLKTGDGRRIANRCVNFIHIGFTLSLTALKPIWTKLTQYPTGCDPAASWTTAHPRRSRREGSSRPYPICPSSSAAIRIRSRSFPVSFLNLCIVHLTTVERLIQCPHDDHENQVHRLYPRFDG